jgi:hypothetical protein
MNGEGGRRCGLGNGERHDRARPFNRRYLWTRGYIPRLRTYPGREVPNPLTVEIRRGSADIEQVMRDVMSLKLNFNAAEFCDGLPGTLRFADLVGEILTAGPITPHAPLPFKFYI